MECSLTAEKKINQRCLISHHIKVRFSNYLTQKKFFFVFWASKKGL